MKTQHGLTLIELNLPESYSMTYWPMGPRAESRSRIQGTGSAMLDDASTFPASPGSIGCSKFD